MLGSEGPAANRVDIVDPHEALFVCLIKMSHDPQTPSNGRWSLV